MAREGQREFPEPSQTEINPVDFNSALDSAGLHLVTLLGSGDYEKGLQVWKERGYVEALTKLFAEKSPDFIRVLISGNRTALLDMLENEVKKKPVDSILTDELTRYAKNYKVLSVVAKLLLFVDTGGYLKDGIYDSNEIQKVSELKINYDELLKLDPGATREGIEYIINETLPESTRRNIASVGFVDRKRKMDITYGPKLHTSSETAATAEGGVGSDGVEIFFWRGMHRNSVSFDMDKEEVVFWKGQLRPDLSVSIWNDTVLHEAGHGDDWLRDALHTEIGHQVLKNMIYLRVQADDRFQSAYVEAISNDDKYEEWNLKAVEYWAEIYKAYLVNDPNLPEIDAKIVKDYIAKQDPNFDRDKALAQRLNKITEMNAETSFQKLSIMQDKYKSWIKQEHGGSEDLENVVMQKLGRAELVNFWRSDLSKEEKSIVMFLY